MELGMVGLGKMGANMALRLLAGGHRVAGYARSPQAVRDLAAAGGTGAASLLELAGLLPPPRTVWVMVPSGAATQSVIDSLAHILADGDTIIDGGNSNYKDTQRRAAALAALGVHLVDVGTSGGIWGLAEGYSLMIGGAPQVVAAHRPIFETLAPAPNQGWGHVGPAGAGHFVKMIHNGIEYGMMQAYAEGFEIMKAKTDLNLSLSQVAEIWRSGSVVRSWLLDLTARALAEDEDLAGISAQVPDSGEGRWTVFEAIDLDVAAPVITAALQRRLRSRSTEPFGDKLLSALRGQFGGHAVTRPEDA